MKNVAEIIIETPKGSAHKYIWDEKRRVLKFKKCMPPGFIFPFNFGMVPGTKAADGDPVDVLLLMEKALSAGVFVEVKIIGALKAHQKKEEKNRNDRLIAVEATCPLYGHYDSIDDLSEKLKKQIEAFFESYNKVQQKEFTPLGWVDARDAMELIKDAVTL